MTARRKEERIKKIKGLADPLGCPLVVALDGAVIANAALIGGVHDPGSAVRAVLRQGGTVFVGLQLDEHEAAEVRGWLPTAAWEGLGGVLYARQKSVVAARKPRR